MTKVSIYEPHTGVTLTAEVAKDAPLEDVVYSFVNLLRAAGFGTDLIERTLSLPHLELEHRIVSRWREL